MGNKKQNHDYEYCRKGQIVEIIIRDSDYRKIEHYKINLMDKKECYKMFSIIEHKYGFINPEIPPEKSVNAKQQNK
jgi:hypothetical protein